MYVFEYLRENEILTDADVAEFDFLTDEGAEVVNNAFKYDLKERKMFFDEVEDVHGAVDYILKKNRKFLDSIYAGLEKEIDSDYFQKITRTRTGTETTDNTGTQTTDFTHGKTTTRTPAGETETLTPAGKTTTTTPAGETTTTTPAAKTTTTTPAGKTTTTTPAGETEEEQGTLTKTSTHETKVPIDSADFVSDEKTTDVETPNQKKTVKTYQGTGQVVEAYQGTEQVAETYGNNEQIVKTYQGTEQVVEAYQGNEIRAKTYQNNEVVADSGKDTNERTDLLKQLLTLNTTEIEKVENPSELIELIKKMWELYETNLLELVIQIIKDEILCAVWEVPCWAL